MKNPATTMFLHQNVILKNKTYTYNQATRTYQEAKSQPLQNAKYQQQQVYVQPQQAYVQPQPQQAYFQPQPVFRVQPQPQQAYFQPQPVFRVQPQPQQAYFQPQPVFRVQPQPQQAYVQPQQAYVQPQQAYVQPQQAYVQPQQAYVQPQQAYVQPQQAYVQPLFNESTESIDYKDLLSRVQLTESRHITEEELETIKDLDKKFPKPDNLNLQKQPIHDNNKHNQNLLPKNHQKEVVNDKKDNRFIFPGATLAESIYLPIGNDDISPIAKNFKSINYRSSESTKLSLEAPSRKFNISPQNQVFQLFKLNALNR
jgi:hypothetical protein